MHDVLAPLDCQNVYVTPPPVFGRFLKAFLFLDYYSIKRIRGFGDDALYKSTFYIKLYYIFITRYLNSVSTVLMSIFMVG